MTTDEQWVLGQLDSYEVAMAALHDEIVRGTRAGRISRLAGEIASAMGLERREVMERAARWETDL